MFANRFCSYYLMWCSVNREGKNTQFLAQVPNTHLKTDSESRFIFWSYKLVEIFVGICWDFVLFLVLFYLFFVILINTFFFLASLTSNKVDHGVQIICGLIINIRNFLCNNKYLKICSEIYFFCTSISGQSKILKKNFSRMTTQLLLFRFYTFPWIKIYMHQFNGQISFCRFIIYL